MYDPAIELFGHRVGAPYVSYDLIYTSLKELTAHNIQTDITLLNQHRLMSTKYDNLQVCREMSGRGEVLCTKEKPVCRP